MPNEAHVEMLKQGVLIWNRWRQENPDIRVRLNAARFQQADLAGVNLNDAILTEADFRGANLSGATFYSAELWETRFSNAILNNSYFGLCGAVGTKFDGADLKQAHFDFMTLIGSNFDRAELAHGSIFYTSLVGGTFEGTDFTDCYLVKAAFCGVDLKRAKGLSAIKHSSPSTVGLDTIYLSAGKIPETFLRGVGVPDNFIDFMHSVAGKTLEFYSCFISYSNKDAEIAERLHADLQSQGVRCWFAPENLKIGDRLRPSFDEAIRLHDKLVVLLSEHSIHSAWVEKEVETAFEKERQQHKTALFPIRLDDAIIEAQEAWAADIRRTRHIGDFSDWKDGDSYKKAFDRLLRDLRAEANATLSVKSGI